MVNITKVKKEEKIQNNILIIIFFCLSVLISLPSIIAYIKNGIIQNIFSYFTLLNKKPVTGELFNYQEALYSGLAFFIVLTILFILYTFIVKKQQKIFKNSKQIYIFIVIISICFAIVIPNTSLDVYSYIASGWTFSNYGENPYYVSPLEIVGVNGDESFDMYSKTATVWFNETCVYGPFWTIICAVLSKLSFGSLTFAVFIFKIFNILVHICNCILINKITRKKQLVLLYGLSPFILFEALANVHNDILIILLILLSIYFVKNKKNLILSVLCISLSICIKYFTIILLPFIVIYYAREKTTIQRLKYCAISMVEVVIVTLSLYAIFIRDLSVFSGLFLQQEKLNRSLLYVIGNFTTESIAYIFRDIFLLAFVIYFAYECIKLLRKKELNFMQVIRKYNIFIAIFTLVLITNFNSWYLMWIFPTMLFAKSKHLNMFLALTYGWTLSYTANIIVWSEEEYLIIVNMITAVVLMVIAYKLKIDKFKIDKKEIKE